MTHPFKIVKSWHSKFGFKKEPMTLEKLQFRLYLQTEEHDELADAIYEKNAEEVVDALIDTIWIACGTLDLLGIDFDKAFGEVARANNTKVRGIKPGREQSGGFDVIKPTGWTGPDHSDNHGVLDDLYKK